MGVCGGTALLEPGSLTERVKYIKQLAGGRRSQQQQQQRVSIVLPRSLASSCAQRRSFMQSRLSSRRRLLTTRGDSRSDVKPEECNFQLDVLKSIPGAKAQSIEKCRQLISTNKTMQDMMATMGPEMTARVLDAVFTDRHFSIRIPVCESRLVLRALSENMRHGGYDESLVVRFLLRRVKKAHDELSTGEELAG